MTDAAHFKAWLDRFFDVFYRDHPVTATFIGRHIHDSELPGDPVAALDDVRSLRDTLDELPEETLEAAWSLDRKLARGFLAIEQWELEAKRYLFTADAGVGAGQKRPPRLSYSTCSGPGGSRFANWANGLNGLRASWVD